MKWAKTAEQKHVAAPPHRLVLVHGSPPLVSCHQTVQESLSIAVELHRPNDATMVLLLVTF